MSPKLEISGRRADARPFDRRRAAVAAIGVLLAVVVLALWFGRRTVTVYRSQPTVEETQPPEPALAAPRPKRASVMATTAPRNDEPAPVIDDIVLEKTEVCSGEENLVSTKAHTVNGTDPWLHFSTDGYAGPSIPVILWLDPEGNVVGNHFVSVFGRMNAMTAVPLPSYKVKPCQPYRVVHVTASVESNSFGIFDMEASIVNLPAPPRNVTSVGPTSFTPSVYLWSFGDGETTTTKRPLVTHDYGGRPQKSNFASFVVRVDVRSAEGDVLTGRSALTISNPGYRDLSQKGIVGLMVSLSPRFPQLESDGRVVQKARLWHIMPEPVVIEHATMTQYYRGAVGQTPRTEVDVAGLLGTTTIPPGKNGIEVTASLDAAAQPEVFSVTYNLTGKSADGLPVMGAFSVMRPPPKPTAESSDPVTDPLLKAEIVAARHILGKDVVNLEDIKHLSREGAFAGLPAPASNPGATTSSRPSPRRMFAAGTPAY